jgi:hypothetical protein
MMSSGELQSNSPEVERLTGIGSRNHMTTVITAVIVYNITPDDRKQQGSAIATLDIGNNPNRVCTAQGDMTCFLTETENERLNNSQSFSNPLNMAGTSASSMNVLLLLSPFFGFSCKMFELERPPFPSVGGAG